MTTETLTIQCSDRAERLVEHLRGQLDVAAKMGGNVQIIMDVKVANGRLVGEACFDLKHRIDLQSG